MNESPPGAGRGPAGASAHPGGGRHRRGAARPDATVDTVVASLVLCTVPDLSQTLAEARRVLCPEGTLRFYQHVRAEDPRLARWQDRLERPWGWLVGGCHPNRDTVAAITAAGLQVVQLDRFDLPAMPALARPHVLGVAERPA